MEGNETKRASSGTAGRRSSVERNSGDSSGRKKVIKTDLAPDMEKNTSGRREKTPESKTKRDTAKRREKVPESETKKSTARRRERTSGPDTEKNRSETRRRNSHGSRAGDRGRKTGKKASKGQAVNFRYAAAAGVVLVILVVIIFAVRSCGVSHKSPEKVVKELINAYSDGKAARAKKCYKVSEQNEEILQKEIDATIQYFEVHRPQKITIDRCNTLSENDKYAYVYIMYSMELENGQSYPCISTYMTGKEDGKYYVYSPSDVTEEMSRQAASDYAKFMTTDIYKDYATAYETFIKKNPGYEDKIAERLQ